MKYAKSVPVPLKSIWLELIFCFVTGEKWKTTSTSFVGPYLRLDRSSRQNVKTSIGHLAIQITVQYVEGSNQNKTDSQGQTIR